MDTQAHPSTALVVEVSDTQSHLRIDPDEVAWVVRRVLDAEGVALASISLAIVDDAAIRTINRRHLAHDWATDVITFPLSEPADPELAGELVLSAETAARAAAEAGTEPLHELTLYIVHGLLHLLGLDDADEPGRVAMRRRETELLARLGLGDIHANAAQVTDPNAGRTPR